MAGIGIYGAIEEQKIYEKKVAQRNAIIRQQQKERDVKEREANAKAVDASFKVADSDEPEEEPSSLAIVNV